MEDDRGRTPRGASARGRAGEPAARPTKPTGRPPAAIFMEPAIPAPREAEPEAVQQREADAPAQPVPAPPAQPTPQPAPARPASGRESPTAPRPTTPDTATSANTAVPAKAAPARTTEPANPAEPTKAATPAPAKTSAKAARPVEAPLKAATPHPATPAKTPAKTAPAKTTEPANHAEPAKAATPAPAKAAATPVKAPLKATTPAKAIPAKTTTAKAAATKTTKAKTTARRTTKASKTTAAITKAAKAPAPAVYQPPVHEPPVDQPPIDAEVPTPVRIPEATVDPRPVPSLWDRVRAEPRQAPELLARAAVERYGPEADRYTRWIRATYPAAGDDRIAQAAARRFTAQARGTALAAVVGRGPGEAAALGWVQARMVLHIAAAYRLDPAAPERAAELLTLMRPARVPVGAGLRAAGRGLATRLVPGAGLLLGALLNDADTGSLARRAISLYRPVPRLP